MQFSGDLAQEWVSSLTPMENSGFNEEKSKLGLLVLEIGFRILSCVKILSGCGTWISSFRVMLPAYQATQNKQKIVEHEYDGDLKI